MLYDPFSNYDQWKTSAPDEDFDDSEESSGEDMINNHMELGEKIYGIDPKEKYYRILQLIEKCVYKYTSCGAWIRFNNEGGITLGSIVAGSDAECTPIDLNYPFSKKDYYDALNSIENEAEYLWIEANEWDDFDDSVEDWGDQ